MPRDVHLTNGAGRDATVQFGAVKAPPPPRRGLPDREVHFARYLSAAASGLHEQLVERLGAEDYGQALVDGDPEVDLELVGRQIGNTHQVFLSSEGEVLHAAPEVIEVVLGPDGTERERRPPQDVEANINDELPVRWTGRKVPVVDAVRRYVFGRTLQVRHKDGLTFDYLHGMASELAAEGMMVVMGGGSKGRDPLVFNLNGTPWRGFLEGRVDGERYMLLLHLTNQELKRPEAS